VGVSVREEAVTSQRVALVIGAGAIKCAAAIGVYDVLEQEGIGIDLVVGCSGGSLYAAYAALGCSADEAAQTTRQLWTRELTARRNRRAVFQVAFPKLFGFSDRFGLIDDRLIRRRLEDAYGERTFADAKVPLFIVATDFHSGEKVVLSEGLLRDAIRGSIAIPFVFSPSPFGERLLTDGSLSDPMPVDVAIRENADVILALGFDQPYQRSIDGMARFAFQVTTVMTNNLMRSNFAFHNLAHHAEVITLVPEFDDSVRAFDTDKLPLIIEKGREAMRGNLPYLRRLLERAG
jgi:NTE family protein